MAKSRKASHQTQASQRVILPMILGVAALLLAGYSWDWSRDILQQRDRQILDGFHVHGKKTPPRDDVVVLAVDDASLKCDDAWEDDLAQSEALRIMKNNRFPWPRKVWADVIDRLVDAGATAVFLDVVFTSPTDEANDRALRECLERHKGKVIIGANFNTSTVNHLTATTLDYPSRTLVAKTPPDDGTWGIVSYTLDSDDVIRRAQYLTTRWKVEGGVPDPEERSMPSVALALARKVNVTASAAVHDTERLRFCDPEDYTPLSLHSIFIPSLWQANFGSGAYFKNKVVLVGVTLQEEQDFKRTPVGVIPGVLVHASALTDVLEHSFIHEAPRWTLWAAIFVGALLAWLMVSYMGHPVLSLLFMWGLTALAVWLAFVLFNQFSMEASPLPFSLALNGCGVLGLTANFLHQLKETRKLSRFVTRYHSPDRVSQLLRDREGLFETLGGAERTVTILFSDVRGFTTMSEGMEPTALISKVNEYFNKMVERVIMFQGSIDKFIGDAVMALWGSMPDRRAGEDVKQDAQKAVKSALGMRESLADLNAQWRSQGEKEIHIGIGIHQGSVVVGNIGSASPFERFEFTVLGDNVNLASRLEGLTKDYACDLIVSESVYQHIRVTHFCRPLGATQVKGKAIRVKIYHVEGLRDGREEPAWFETYALAMEACYLDKDLGKARTLMEHCKAQAPDDIMANYFLGKWPVAKITTS